MVEKWDVRTSQDLRTLSAKFDAVDPEAVIERGLTDTMKEAQEIVRLHVVNHPDINAPAFIGPYERGPGPSMSQKTAWKYEKTGKHSFVIQPHPKVRQRAVILEYGTVDPITTQSKDALKFTVNGVPMFRKEVSGIEARGYWRAAMQEIRSKGVLEEKIEDEWNDELEKYF